MIRVNTSVLGAYNIIHYITNFSVFRLRGREKERFNGGRKIPWPHRAIADVRTRKQLADILVLAL
jgi:hypothetical protein